MVSEWLARGLKPYIFDRMTENLNSKNFKRDTQNPSISSSLRVGLEFQKHPLESPFNIKLYGGRNFRSIPYTAHPLEIPLNICYCN